MNVAKEILFYKQFRYKPYVHCNQSAIHLNKSGTNGMIGNLLFAMSKFDC